MNDQEMYDRFCDDRFRRLELWQEKQNGALILQTERIDGIYKLMVGGLITLFITMVGVAANLVLLLVKLCTG